MQDRTDTAPAPAHALEGVRVIDFSWVLAGPMATKTLALMGAEVIKIESGRRAEYARRDGVSTIINTAKRSCTIDITRPEGQQLVRRLMAVSDMVVENFSAGVLPKYGLGYADMRAVREDVIFVSGSGLGRSGPQRDALAYGTLLQAYSGRAGMIGEINTDLEGMGIHGWTDPITAAWEGLAMLAALLHRRRTGLGAYIDLSMLESTVALLPEALLREALGTGTPAVHNGGNSEAGAVPCGCFACAGEDEWVAVSVKTNAEWRALCVAIERPDLAADPRHAHAMGRLARRDAINQEFARWARLAGASAIEARLREAGVPAARSRHVIDILEDAHLRERKLFPALADGQHVSSLPWRDEHGRRGRIEPPPSLGADNEYVFGELLGLSRDEIGTLRSCDVIG